MRNIAVFIFGISLPLFISCTACSLPFGEDPSPEELTIVSWNLQNLFDDVSDGAEYDEFDPEKGTWNSDLFYKRLGRVEEVFNVLFDEYPHIILLQEIENLNTLEILNREFLKNSYTCEILIENESSSINTALLSRIPVKSVSSVEPGYWGPLKLRPILEVHFDLNGNELVLLNNHWKSKSGGSAATEEGRIMSAEVLSDRIKKLIGQNEEVMIIAAGDFNENYNEYKKVNRAYRTGLIPEIEDVPPEWDTSIFITSKTSGSKIDGERLVLYSPWYDVSSSGSYAYKSQWSKIDNFFLWRTLMDGNGYEYNSFRVVKDPLLLNDYNYPSRWISYSEEGYSDHLPIQLKLMKAGY